MRLISACRARRYAYGLEAQASDPRWKAGISVCSLSSIRSRCRERPCHRRPAARGRPGHPRGPPLSERAGAAERLAAVGHPAALARDAPVLRQASTAPGSTASASTPGAATYALLGERGEPGPEPVPLSRFAHRRGHGRGLQAGVRPTRSMASPASSSCRSTRSISSTPRASDAQADRRRVDTVVTIPDLLNYWLTGIARRRIHQRHDDAVRGCADAVLGEGRCSTALDIPTRLLPPIVEPGPCVGRLQGRRVRRRFAGHAGRRAGVPRHRIGGGVGRRPAAAAPSSARAPGRCSARKSTTPIITAALAGAELHQRRRRLRHDAAAQEHRRDVAAAGVPPDLGVATGSRSTTTSC